MAEKTTYVVVWEEFGDVPETLFCCDDLEKCREEIAKDMEKRNIQLLCEEDNFRHYDHFADLCISAGVDPESPDGNYLLKKVKVL